MTFEEASDMMDLQNIDPSLTCTCDEVHICQQCMHDIDDEETKQLKEHTLN